MISITEWVSNLFSSKKEKNNHQLKIKTCCPNCFHQYNLDLVYSTTIEVKHNLTNDEIYNINHSKRADIEKKYKQQNTYNNNKNSKIETTVEKQTYKVKTELAEDDLKFSTMGEFIEKNKNLKNSQEKSNSINKDDHKDTQFYTDTYSNAYDQTYNVGNLGNKKIPNSNKNKINQINQINQIDNKRNSKKEEYEKYKIVLLSKDLDKIKKHSQIIIPDLRIIDYAVEHIYDIQIIKILFEANSIWSSQSLSLAMKSGDLKIINFMIDNGACDKLTNNDCIDTFTNALAFDNYEYLDKLKKSGLQMPNNILQLAIQKKALKVISHLISIGYKFTPGCFEEAVQIGDIKLLEILKSNNCEWGELSDYVKNNLMYNDDIVQWLQLNNCPWDICDT